jgi:hypothetical protein
MHVSTVGNERIDYSKVAITGRVVQWSCTIVTSGIHILAQCNEGIDHGKVAIKGRHVQQ